MESKYISNNYEESSKIAMAISKCLFVKIAAKILKDYFHTDEERSLNYKLAKLLTTNPEKLRASFTAICGESTSVGLRCSAKGEAES